MKMSDESISNKVPLGFKLRHKLRGDGDVFMSIAWSPDGQTIAGGAEYHTIRLWDAKTGELRRKMNERFNVYEVAWSPDGEMIASTGASTLIHLRSTQTGRLLRRKFEHPLGANVVTWSKDGRTLASAGTDGIIRLWDIETGRLKRTLEGHTDEVITLAWSPRGDYLASGGNDRIIRVWDTKNGELFRYLEGHNYQIVSMAWAPDAGILDQPRLAVAGDARNIVIWSPFLRVPVRALRDHTRIVKSIDFSADGRLFASKSDDGTVRVWRCDTWQTVGVLEEPGSPLWPPNLAFHPSAPTTLATLGEFDRIIRIWDLTL